MIPLFLDDPVMAIGDWKTNGVLIADIARMGRYLHWRMRVWDASWGHGRFWTHWRPRQLIGTDADPGKGAPDGVWDAREPLEPAAFDAVIWDGPYKLNGSPSDPDRPYGVDVVDTRDGRHELLLAGLCGAIAATKPGGYVLAKSMAQVNSGRKWWQPRLLADRAELAGCRQVDEFHFRAYRPQPNGTSQQHARSNYSTLTVFQVPERLPDATLFGAAA